MTHHSLLRASAAGIAILLGAGVAQAADVIMEEPPAPAPVVEYEQPAGWAGGYAGATFGYGFEGRAGGAAGGDIDTDGYVGSGFAGYNWQSGNIVYGAEADVGYGEISGGNGVNDTRSKLNGTVRARVGVAPTDRILVYGTAGGAAERMRLHNTEGAMTETMYGYTVGAGVDTKITDQVFGRVEYRYTDYGSQDFTINGTTQDVDNRDHKVQVGLGVKF